MDYGGAFPLNINQQWSALYTSGQLDLLSWAGQNFPHLLDALQPYLPERARADIPGIALLHARSPTVGLSASMDYGGAFPLNINQQWSALYTSGQLDLLSWAGQNFPHLLDALQPYLPERARADIPGIALLHARSPTVGLSASMDHGGAFLLNIVQQWSTS